MRERTTPEPERLFPRRPAPTGRDMVVFRRDAVEDAIRGLERTLEKDFDKAKPHFPDGDPVSANEVTLFRSLGVAVMPRDVAAALTVGDAPIIAHEPELRRYPQSWSRILRRPRARAVRPSATAFQASPAAGPWWLADTGALESRFSGRGVRVAILDTGLVASDDPVPVYHPDLQGRTIFTKNFAPRDPLHYSADHGTKCVGVACGPARSLLGPRYGVAYGADIYFGKVFQLEPGEPVETARDEWILSGICWALANRCAVINLSLGSPTTVDDLSFSLVYEAVAQRALAAGSLIVAGAGNTPNPGRLAPVEEPANCPSILAVSAVDDAHRSLRTSCGGVHVNGGDIDLCAPGEILSIDSNESEQGDFWGTSAAAALVTGVAALHAEAFPGARGEELWRRLRRSARPLEPLEKYGFGLVQAP